MIRMVINTIPAQAIRSDYPSMDRALSCVLTVLKPSTVIPTICLQAIDEHDTGAFYGINWQAADIARGTGSGQYAMPQSSGSNDDAQHRGLEYEFISNDGNLTAEYDEGLLQRTRLGTERRRHRYKPS